MKVKHVLIAIIGCAALCLTLPAFGQYYGTYNSPPNPALSNGEQVTVQFTGSYVDTYAGEGAGIYTGGVTPGWNASQLAGNNAGLICDDYHDQIGGGQRWNATAYLASDLTAANVGNTLFGNSIGLAGYAELATLVSMMFGNGVFGGTTYSHAQISAAIWDITTAGGINLPAGSPEALLEAAVKTFVGSQDLSAYMKEFGNLWILTPDPHPGPPNDPGQEMWIKSPEGGAALLYLLMAGLACFGAMKFNAKNLMGNRLA